ncbi:NADH-ubiquinone oxidoreductase chain L [alpha proteobacterium U9-1i]|nr:NADH-ubiquinone oxidoreductase chain L [alpha proteobacterium U9-1i]
MLALGAPVVGAILVLLAPRPPGLRDVIHIGAALTQAIAAAHLAALAASGEGVRVVLARPLPGVDFAFALEPLGALMAALLSGLGVLHAIHSAGVARATHDKTAQRLMAYISLASAATMGVAYSANLFTFYVVYQALTLATFPMIAYGGDEDAQRAARSYLATLLGASVGLLLPALVWTYAVAGELDFRPGGLLAGRVDAFTATALLVLYVFGLAKVGLPPVHGWVSAASKAQHSAQVSLFATSVLPAGGVGLIKVAAYVFGSALHEVPTTARILLLLLVGVSMCVAALIALSKQDLRERFAYSAMAQSLAVAMGALLAHPTGIFAAALQVVALACGAATLTMAAGAVFAATGRTDARDTAGLGRVMPWTFAGFAIACASMVGMPPFAGAWAKLWLIAAAADTGLISAAVLAGAAAVLTFAHLGPLAANALAGKAPTDPFKRADGASIMLVAPVILSGAATLWLLVVADPLAHFLSPLWMGSP